MKTYKDLILSEASLKVKFKLKFDPEKAFKLTDLDKQDIDDLGDELKDFSKAKDYMISSKGKPMLFLGKKSAGDRATKKVLKNFGIDLADVPLRSLK